MTDIKAKHQFMNIEFLRIIAILAIIMLHIFNSGMGLHNLGLNVHFYDKLFKMTSNGQKGVDFFFILSGLFLYTSMIKLPEQPLFPFVCKKIIRLWPVMVFATLLAFVLSLFGLLKFTYWDNIYALLFLNGTPLAINQGNISVTWYCSALMVHFILFFYLFQNVPKKYFWLLVCILIYVSYGVMLQAKNFGIGDQKQTFGYIFHVGMMRASGGIGIGLLLGYWYTCCKVFIEKYRVTMIQKCAITTIEFVTLYFMINNLMLHKFQHHNQFMFIIAFMVLIWCFLINKGYISALFNREIFPKLSKYIYSIFVTHQIVINVLRGNLWATHRDLIESYPITNMIGTLLLIMVIGVLTYHLVEAPSTKYLRQKILHF